MHKKTKKKTELLTKLQKTVENTKYSVKMKIDQMGDPITKNLMKKRPKICEI